MISICRSWLLLLVLSSGALFSLFPASFAHANTGGTFISTGSMSSLRLGQTATLLQNGKVLIAGGDASNNTAPYLNTAELYDPNTGTFTLTGNMTERRGAHTATLLPNGKVLIVGGTDGWDYSSKWLNTAELYDPSTGTFTPTGSMSEYRGWHEATLLNNGKVLIVGGYHTDSNRTGTYLNTAELYDPATGTFSQTGSMQDARIWFALTPLRDGTIMVAGGSQQYSGWLTATEIYNPTTGTFTSKAPFHLGRWIQNGTLLPDNSILWTGGIIPGDTRTDEVERYDPATNVMSVGGNLITPRYGSTQSLLPDGTVLVIGGYGANGFLDSVEVYNPTTNTTSLAAHSLTVPRYQHRATTLQDGTILITGGLSTGGATLGSAEIFTNNTNSVVSISTITTPTDPVNSASTLPVVVTAIYADTDTSASHACTVDFADGSGQIGGTAQNGICTASHVYSVPGVYTVTVTVTGQNGSTASKAASDYIVVYNPNGGSVSGNGQIISPTNSFKANPLLTGIAKFGFVSAYKKGATIPTGNTKFEFSIANMKFESSNYQWLVVNQNGQNAQYNGDGSINGTGMYHFMLWAGDKDQDTFRLKITDQGGGSIYDNGTDQVIDKGQIKIKVN